MEKNQSILQIFPESMRRQWMNIEHIFPRLQEIRFRINQPYLLVIDGQEHYMTEIATLTKEEEKAKIMSMAEMKQLIEHICHYSIYAYEDEIRQGFITLAGGHRIGVAGQVVIDEIEKIRTIKYITYVNIRISHEIIGVANSIRSYLYENKEYINTLFISPPGCGKTTILRDTIRQLSKGTVWGDGVMVGVVDERSEIGGCYKGIPQNDLGPRTDIMDRCPKHVGMMMLIRSMAPQIIAVDELGSTKDLEALQVISSCGCKVLATIHGEGIEDLVESEYGNKLLQKKLFKRYIVLGKEKGKCKVKGIYGKDLEHV